MSSTLFFNSIADDDFNGTTPLILKFYNGDTIGSRLYFDIYINNDDIVEKDETFSVYLNDTDVDVHIGSATVYIIDDDSESSIIFMQYMSIIYVTIQY